MHEPDGSKEKGSGANILLVDDSENVRLQMEFLLHRHGFTTECVTGVNAGIRLCEKTGLDCYDCILADYYMADGTGIDFLNWVRQRDDALAAIIVTGMMEKGLVSESMRIGACDFLEKPVVPNVLTMAVERAVALTRYRRQLRRSAVAVQQVRRLQQLILRTNQDTKLLQVDLYSHPKFEAGGDTLTRFPLQNDQYAFLLTDVSGHDLKAAFLSAYCQGFVRGVAEDIGSLEQGLKSFGTLLEKEWNSSQITGHTGGLLASVSICGLLIDLKAQNARVYCCGAPLPVLVDEFGQPQTVGTNDSPLGWETSPTISCHLVPTSHSEAFMFWSDGLEILADAKSLPPLTLATSILLARAGLRPIIDCNDAQDDIMVARIQLPTDTPAKGALPFFSAYYEKSQISQIDQLQALWNRVITCCLPNISEEAVFNILLASREAVLNGLQHGCKATETEGRTFFSLIYLPVQNAVRVIVIDPGTGFDFEENEKAESLENQLESHCGLTLIKNLASSVQMLQSGTFLLLNFLLSQAVEPPKN